MKSKTAPKLLPAITCHFMQHPFKPTLKVPITIFRRFLLVCIYVHKSVHTPLLMACFGANFAWFSGGFPGKLPWIWPEGKVLSCRGMRKRFPFFRHVPGGWFVPWPGVGRRREGRSYAGWWWISNCAEGCCGINIIFLIMVLVIYVLSPILSEVLCYQFLLL